MTPVDIDKLKERAVPIIARLRASAPSASKALQMMAEAKSLRQGHNPPCKDLYAWPKPEETTEARAADLIETLIAKAERVDALERALGPFVSGSVVSVTDDDSIPDHAMGSIQVTMGELRAARNALSPKESE